MARSTENRRYYYHNDPNTVGEHEMHESPMDRTKAHQKLVDDLMLEFGSRPDVRIFVRPVGYDDDNHIKYGIPGECDLDGIVAPWGLRLGIEVKTGEGKLNPKQVIWRNMIEKFGGIHIVARSVEQAKLEFEQKLAAQMKLFKKLIDESGQGQTK